MDVLSLVTLINIGFSMVMATIFFVVYAFFLDNVIKTAAVVAVCLFLLGGLACLQLAHLTFVLEGGEPLEGTFYRVLIFSIPSLFFLFSRLILFADYQLSLSSLLHFSPLLLVVFTGKESAAIIAFLIGTAYCFWILSIVYRLRGQYKRFGVELFFFGMFAGLALLVLVMGISVSFIDSRYFYLFYANGIGVAFILIAACFMIYPNLISELSEVITLGYSNSTLKHIDIPASLVRLDELMAEKIFQNENLNLALLAEHMSLSAHQLSELINTQFGQNFSKYIRTQRVEEAKRLLKDQPKISVLSIGMEVGFKSQSSFYTAFNEVTGMSPGQFR